MARRPRPWRSLPAVTAALLLVACSGPAPGGAASLTGQPSPAASAGGASRGSAAPTGPALPGILGSVEVGAGPCALEVAPSGAVFVTLYNARTVVRVDPATGSVTTLAHLDGPPCGIAWADGSLWVGVLQAHQLLRLDPGSGEVQQTIALAGDPWDVQPGGGRVWVVDRGVPAVIGFDAKTGTPGPMFTTDFTATGLAYVDGHAWVAVRGTRQVIRLTAGGDAAETSQDAGSQPTWFADGGGSLWVTDLSGAVIRIDPASGRAAAAVQLDGMPRDPVFAFGALWVAESSHGILYRISPDTDAVTGMVELKVGIWTVEQVGQEVWVENFSDSEIYRIDPTSVPS